MQMPESVSKLVIFAMALGTLIALAVYFSGPAPVYCQQSFATREHKVVMFSSRFCPYCRQARLLFAQHHIRYCEYNVKASPENQQQFVNLGGLGVPLIMIGNEVFYGFNESIITLELERQGFL